MGRLIPATTVWHAVDAHGLDLATGRLPRPPGAPSPAAALASAPVARWPLAATGDAHRLDLAAALGPGGRRVQDLLARLMASPVPPSPAEVAALALATPAGPLDLPVTMVSLAEGVERSEGVDPGWLRTVDRRRSSPRAELLAAGREDELEAALNIAVLLATDRLDPHDDADPDAHVASGAQLWLLGGAVAWALSGDEPDPFAPWAELVVCGIWPVGPSGGRLVVCPDGRRVPAPSVPDAPATELSLPF